MRAIILAGGRGSRLDPLTRHLPKPLIPFFGRPLIEYQIRWLSQYGFNDVIVSLGHLGSQIETALGHAWHDTTIRYVYEKSPLGTAGAVIHALSMDPTEEAVLVIPGDCLADFDLATCYDALSHYPQPMGLVAHSVEDAHQFGVVDLHEDGTVQKLIEKPSIIQGRQWVNTGIYVIQPHFLESIHELKLRPLDFAYDIFPQLVAQGQLRAYTPSDGYWSDLGTLNQYRQSHFDVLSGRIALGYDVTTNSTIHLGARVIAPVWLGNNVTIDAEASVGPFVVVGDDSYIGPWTHVERAVIGQGAFLGVGTKIQDAVIDARVAIGGRCHIDSQCAIGADSRLGWGSHVSRGSRLAPFSRVAPTKRAIPALSPVEPLSAKMS